MATIKIDEELLKKIKKFIKEGDNRFEYPNVKAFIDKMVYSYLKEHFKEKKKVEDNKKQKQKE